MCSLQSHLWIIPTHMNTGFKRQPFLRELTFRLQTNSLELSPSWGANSSLTSGQILIVLHTLKLCYLVNKSPPIENIFGQMNAIHTSHPASSISVILPYNLGLPIGLFPSGFPGKTQYSLPFNSMCAVLPTHLNFNGLVFVMISGEKFGYKALVVQCSPSLTFHSSNIQISPSALIFIICSYSNWRDRCSVYIFMPVFYIPGKKTKDSETNWIKHVLNLICFYSPYEWQLLLSLWNI